MTYKPKYYLIIALVLSVFTVFAQSETNVNTGVAYKNGEYLKYRVHYGFMNAGYVTFKLNQTKKNGYNVYHAKALGRTTGAAKLFFDVNDRYESYFTLGNKIKPVHFIRRVNENGYLIQRDLTFDYNTNKVKVEDIKKNTTEYYTFNDVQDMVSVLYHLRNIEINTIKPGDIVNIDMFFDGETFPFKLRFEGKEVLNTKFGKVRTWRIKPMVQKGRFFEDQESLTIWISDDANKVPILIKASLVVGSIKADLDHYYGLGHTLAIVND